jgi:hypothetical protein
MDITTLLIIVVVILLLGGGGWYGRGRWYGRDGRLRNGPKEDRSQDGRDIKR